MQFPQFVFVELSRLLRCQFLLPVFVGLLDALNTVTTNFQNFLEDLIHDFDGSADKNFLGCSCPDLEESTVDFVDGYPFNSLLGVVYFSQFAFDFFLVKICDGCLVGEQFLQDGTC